MRAHGIGAVALAVAATTTPVFAQSFTIPLVVDFLDERYEDYHRHVARQLQGDLAGGGLTVESQDPPGQCRSSRSSLGGDRRHATFVDVVSRPRPGSYDGEKMLGAGLLIRYSEDGPRFLALLLREDGYELLAFAGGSVLQRIGGDIPEGTDWPVRAAARETANGAEFFLNGLAIGGLSDSRVSGSTLGLIHCGPGSYQFDNWGQNTRGDIGSSAEDPATPTAEASTQSEEPGPPPLAGPGAAPPPLDIWWVEDEGAPVGPMSIEALRRRIEDGRSTPRTLVWRKGMADWAPAADALPEQ